MRLALASDVEECLFDRIGSMLARYDLDSSPVNYTFCHRYLSGQDPLFTAAVDHAIAGAGTLNTDVVAEINRADGTVVSAETLQKMADEAQAFLARITGIVDDSGREVRAYNDALDAQAAAITGSGKSDASRTLIAGLVNLTKTMIDKSRDAGEHLRRTGDEIEALRTKLVEARANADSDALTGLPNRRALDERMRHACALAEAQGSPLAIAICDIDHFKRVNDVHGHQVGDEVIKMMASALGGTGDAFVSRYGGEEFVVLFDAIDAVAAARMIDRIRNEMASRDIKVTTTGRRLGRITFSAGVADFRAPQGGSDMLRRADEALYKAKDEGRDRVLVAEG